MTDGGSVYSQPDFDAQVADYLPFKAKLWVTKKAVSGNGGLGLFHRVRYKDKSGYMVDTDIRLNAKGEADPVPNKKTAANSSAARSAKTRDPEVEPAKRERDRERAREKPGSGAEAGDPLYFKRYLGGALSLVNYTEKFQGNKFSDKMTMYGLRMSGPGTLFDGPPLDLNVWFSLQKPGYYSKFASGSPQGFLLFGDLMAVLPFYENHSFMVTYGMGLMWTYTNYKVMIKNSRFDSQEFRIGVDFGVGLTQRFGHYAAKLDVKYYYEKTQYFGYIASFQVEY